MVAAYETRLADARRETAGLRAALSQLEKEHRALVNEQVRIGARSSTTCILLQPVAEHLAHLPRHSTSGLANQIMARRCCPAICASVFRPCHDPCRLGKGMHIEGDRDPAGAKVYISRRTPAGRSWRFLENTRLACRWRGWIGYMRCEAQGPEQPTRQQPLIAEQAPHETDALTFGLQLKRIRLVAMR